jgi:hypothetical protein
MATQTKACVACAEPIQVGAQLCKHCKTMQDDKRFMAKATKPQVVSPSTTKAKAKPFVPGECVRCSSPVSNASVRLQYLCSTCIYGLNKRQSKLYNSGKLISLCPTCNDRIHVPEISSQCDHCTSKIRTKQPTAGVQEPSKTNFLVSWWAQLILVFVVLINPNLENFSSPIVLFLNIGAQLVGWNMFISPAFAIAVFVIRRNLRNPIRTTSWLFSSLLFLAIGILLVLITLSALSLGNA